MLAAERLDAPLRGREAVVTFLERIRPKTPIPGCDMLDPVVQQEAMAPC